MKECIEQYFTDEEGTTTLDPEEILWSPPYYRRTNSLRVKIKTTI
jgi:hypothetical protein